ncbi:MAG: ERF family protein [Halomonas sp.]
MRTSPSVESIIPALVAAQGEIGGRVAKDAKNPHYRNTYATLDAVLSLAVPVLSRHQLWLTQEPRRVEGGVEIETAIYHASGEWVAYEPVFMPASKADAQGYGSAITYGRRYALLPVLSLAPADDDGNAAAASAPAAVQYITAQQAEELRSRMEALGADAQRFLQYLGVPALEQLPASALAKARAALDAKAQQAAQQKAAQKAEPTAEADTSVTPQQEAEPATETTEEGATA